MIVDTAAGMHELMKLFYCPYKKKYTMGFEGKFGNWMCAWTPFNIGNTFYHDYLINWFAAQNFEFFIRFDIVFPQGYKVTVCTQYFTFQSQMPRQCSA